MKILAFDIFLVGLSYATNGPAWFTLTLLIIAFIGLYGFAGKQVGQ